MKKKIVAIWSLLSIVLNMAQPAFIALTLAPIISPNSVRAEGETSPEPTVAPAESSTPTSSIEPTAAPSTSPIESVAPSADPSVSPSTAPTSSPDATLTPSATPDLSPSPAGSIAPITDSNVPSNPAPANDSSPAPPSSSATPTPTNSPTPTPELNEQLNISVIDNTAAESIQEFDLTVTESGSATLSTDKADYAPTDTAIITGSGFQANTTYKLVISSTDEPATSTTVNVTTDADGTLFFAYQLDGNYRPNYKVEAYLGSTLVVTITFTDSPLCQNDVNGANDVSGQKDLTKMCNLGSTDSTRTNTSWNWDDISWSGNNTGDACNLFDTDNDGKVNYAVCVTIGGSQAAIQSTSLYSCGDDKADRCSQPSNLIAGPYTTNCGVVTSSDDPFAAGNAYPGDTKGTCNIFHSEIGNSSTTKLIDVCSYPSQQPNSDPSDCIVATQAQTGKLEVVKNLIPTSDSGQFNLIIDNSILATGGNGTTTGKQVVLAGGGAGTPHTFAETAGSNTLLSDYTTSVACVKGSTSVSVSGSNPWTVNVGNNDDITCTITNTLRTGNLIVHKDVQGPNGEAVTDTSTNFTIQNDGANSQSITDNGTVTYSNVAAGNHTITETSVPTAYSLYGISTTAGSVGTPSGLSVNVPAGGTANVYVTNRQNNATVTIHKNVLNPDGGEVSDTHSFNVLRGGSDSKVMAEGTDAVYTLVPGTYTFTEGTDSDYTLDSITGDNDAVATNGTTLTVGPGSTTSLTFVNKQKKANITVTKNVVAPNGTTDISDNHTFSVTLNGVTKDFSENTSASFTVNPGTYSAVEGVDGDYTLISNDSPKTVGSNGSATINIVNKQKSAKVEVIKDVIDPDGNAVSDNHSFSAKLDGGDSQSFSENSITTFTVDPGTHTVTEVADADYTYIGCTPDADTNTVGAQLNLTSNQKVRVTCTNRQQKATITVIKDVVKNDGSPVADSHLFSVTLDGISKLFGEGANQTFTVNPGTYGAVEGVDTNYTYVSDTGSVNVGSNGSASITITNKQNAGTISGYKFNSDGSTPISGWTIELLSCASDFTNCVLGTSTTTGANGAYSFSNLLTGFYQVREVLQSGWSNLTSLSHNLTVAAGSVLGDNNFTNFENVSVKACKLEDADGNLNTTSDRASVAGWTVKLLTDGNVSDTQTTGIDGCYTWTDLGPGHAYGTSESASTAGWTALSDTSHDFGAATTGAVYEFNFINFKNAKIVVHKNVLGTDGQTDVVDTTTFSSLLDGVNSKTIAEGTDSVYSDLGPGSYIVSEDTTPSGYSLVSITNGGVVNVASGATFDVYIVNKQNSASLTVIKNVVNDNNGNAVSSDFTMNLTGTNLSDDSFPGSESGTTVTLDAGDYSVNESAFAGYTPSLSDDCSGTITFGESKTCTITNDDIQPKLTVTKIVTNNNGGTKVVSDFPLFVGNKSVTSGDKNGFNAGTYTVSETGSTGYYATFSGDCDANGSVTLSVGDDKTCTITNDDQPGTLIVNKTVINDNGGTSVASNFSYQINGDSAVSFEADGSNSQTLDSGYYSITEPTVSGYTTTYNNCTKVFVPNGDSTTCAITNDDQPGRLVVTKYNDNNGDGIQQENEPTLSGWTINIGEGETLLTDETDENGEVVFDQINAGRYNISEIVEDGWIQTNISCSTDEKSESVIIDNDNSHTATVNLGATTTCQVGNQAKPALRIQKTNNAEGSKNPGDLVTYTITLDLTGSDLSNVVVTDVTPDGFTYVLGSWTASINGNPLAIEEPNYGSPGTWNVGPMNSGDVVVLTYQAKIGSDQDAGTYNDSAWAVGSSRTWPSVLALGHDSEYVDGMFVGTDVAVNKTTQQTGSVDIEREGEVLGASTSLPATGANSNWLFLALSTLIAGIFMIFGGKRMQKLFISAFIILIPFMGGTVGRAHAADVDNNLSVRIEQPASPTRLNEWKLSFSVLDRMSRTPVVNCYVKKPNSGSFVSFGATHNSIKAEGDNGNCQVNSSVMSEQGDYQFKVIATAGSDSEESTTVTVKYDTSGPGTPNYYNKEHPSYCRWIIKFHTADDNGATSKVEIYSSDKKNFDTNDGTRVGSVNIGSNQDGSFTHDRANDCDREWYYVIRAFDSAGNQSDHRGDEMTVTTTTASSSPAAAALVTTRSTGSVLGKADSNVEESKEDQVNQEEQTTEKVEGEGLVAGASDAAKDLVKNKKTWWVIIALAILGFAYGYSRKKTAK